MSDINGQIAVITAGTGKLGFEIAVALASEGAHIALGYSDRDQSQQARRLAATITSRFGVRALAVCADTSKWGDIDDMIWTVESELGNVGILVNNAENIPAAVDETLPQLTWQNIIATTLTSALSMTQRVLPGMHDMRFGRLIMIPAIADASNPIIARHHAACNAGLNGLIQSYANSLAQDGITANVITPCRIENENRDATGSSASISSSTLHNSRATELTELVVTLARCGSINGQIITMSQAR
ncbi:MAG TPA: SDR family NAD(P)-dependent oxidoreductase [Spongiibacteraceae bacterium]|nr:SDR family NAD(P)-dependent oxidoreductase [Spongiibacteraceae bacterium]